MMRKAAGCGTTLLVSMARGASSSRRGQSAVELPSSFKDISYSIKDYSKTQELQDLLLSYQCEIIKNVYIFDYFKNEKQEEIKIGFRFVFQSKKTTLNSAEIELVCNDIVNQSLRIGGISIPGM